jgi:hypothetical protein
MKKEKPKMAFVQKQPSFDIAGYSIRVHGDIHAPTFHAGDVRILLSLPAGVNGWLTGEEVMELCRSVSRLPARLLHAHLEKFLPALK